jgi:hypothetical protein
MLAAGVAWCQPSLSVVETLADTLTCNGTDTTYTTATALYNFDDFSLTMQCLGDSGHYQVIVQYSNDSETSADSLSSATWAYADADSASANIVLFSDFQATSIAKKDWSPMYDRWARFMFIGTADNGDAAETFLVQITKRKAK